jgi:hypothetical protein
MGHEIDDYALSIEPFTDPVLEALARQGQGRLMLGWVDAVEKGLKTSPNSDSADCGTAVLEAAMMGRRCSDQARLFYQFRCGPKTHIEIKYALGIGKLWAVADSR